MRSSSLTASTAIMILLLTACGGETEPPAATTPTDSSTQAPATTAAPEAAKDPAAQKPPEAPPGADFKSPMVPGNDPTAIGNLLQPTSPEQRLAQIERERNQNRSNPFGAPGLKIQPVEQMRLSPPEQLEQAVKNLQPLAVPDLPELPLLSQTTVPGAPPQEPRSVPALPGLPLISRTTGAGAPPQEPRSVRALPGLPLISRTTGPGTPPQEPRSVPALPGLPLISLAPSATQTPLGVSGGNGTTPGSNQGQPQGEGNGQPIAQIPPSAQAPRGVPDLPKLPTPIGPKLPPEPVAQAPQAPPSPPPPPDTKLADATEVTGVIEVGNQIQIIAKAPNEPSSRYIKVGQKIANGQVTVKRVEKEDGEPIVILEQNGVEVRKPIGQAVAIATDDKK